MAVTHKPIAEERRPICFMAGQTQGSQENCTHNSSERMLIVSCIGCRDKGRWLTVSRSMSLLVLVEPLSVHPGNEGFLLNKSAKMICKAWTFPGDAVYLWMALTFPDGHYFSGPCFSDAVLYRLQYSGSAQTTEHHFETCHETKHHSEEKGRCNTPASRKACLAAWPKTRSSACFPIWCGSVCNSP